MRSLFLLAASAVSLAACSSGSPAPAGSTAAAPVAARPARSASDSRVRTLRGTVPPELAANARTLNAPATTLAALRGRVVFVQFAFPT